MSMNCIACKQPMEPLGWEYDGFYLCICRAIGRLIMTSKPMRLEGSPVIYLIGDDQLQLIDQFMNGASRW